MIPASRSTEDGARMDAEVDPRPSAPPSSEVPGSPDASILPPSGPGDDGLGHPSEYPAPLLAAVEVVWRALVAILAIAIAAALTH